MRWVLPRWVDLVWLLAFGAASSAWCLSAATKIGAVFDEPYYIKAGLSSWETSSNKPLMRSGVMTLPPDVQTLPIYLWERLRGQEFDPVGELHTVLPLARGMNLVFWWLLLVYSMRLGRTFGGAWGGRIAVALAACDPNLLGHATLATTDIASVACLLVLVYHFWHGLGDQESGVRSQESEGSSRQNTLPILTPDSRLPTPGWKRRVLVPGLCYGLAIQAKASGMVFGMEAMLVLGLWHLARSGELTAPPGLGIRGKLAHLWHAAWGLRKDLAVIAAIGFTCVFAYTGSDWKAEPEFTKWAEGLPEGNLKSVMVPVSHELRIFTNAGEGLLFQIKHNIGGHGTFLNGTWYDRATWQYFPVVLSMKAPLPVFALLGAVLLIHWRNLLTPPAAIAFLLFALSPTCRVQIGVRFMFPVIVLGYVALAAAIARGWAVPGPRCVPRWFVAGTLASLTAISVWVWPHGISYFNQLWGGPEAGPRLLHDSNCDWGQGLPELKAWVKAHNLKSIAVWYAGNDPAVYAPPFHRVELSYMPHGGTPDGIRWACAGEELVAVSVGALFCHESLCEEHRLALAWVRTQTPIDRTTFFVVYRVP
jgi:hypothetical protein